MIIILKDIQQSFFSTFCEVMLISVHLYKSLLPDPRDELSLFPLNLNLFEQYEEQLQLIVMSTGVA